MTRHKIESLINEIEEEHGNETPFQICGNKSLFAKQAEIYEIYSEVLGEIKKQDTHLFLRLYDSAQNGGQCTGMSREAFDQAISKALVAIKQYRPLGDYGYNTLIYMVRAYSRKLDRTQHSCFTWAREKLGTIGIKLADNQLEGIISITTLYATHKPNQKTSECKSCIILETKTEEAKKYEGKKLYARFVTYDLNRDQRTEEWKIVEKQSIRNHRLSRVADAVTNISMLACTVFAPMASVCFVAPAAPIVALSVSGLILSFGIGIASGEIREGLRQKQSSLYYSAHTKKHLTQPGNDISTVKQIPKPERFN
ncbi:MAG: hypothetical protein ACXWM7_06915 [Parachlamydiaceae bacterium]